MTSRKKLPKKSKLCVIIDRSLLTRRQGVRTASESVRAGAEIIQLRCKDLDTPEAVKTAEALRRITLGRAVFIVNDRVDIAVASGADGLHIGRGDVSPFLARKLLGKKVLGISASSIKEAKLAKKTGASYLGVGPVFQTPIKRGRRPGGVALLEKVKKLKIPFFAIGGIDEKNITGLVSRGFCRVAVIRSVCAAPDPYFAARRLKEAL